MESQVCAGGERPWITLPTVATPPVAIVQVIGACDNEKIEQGEIDHILDLIGPEAIGLDEIGHIQGHTGLEEETHHMAIQGLKLDQSQNLDLNHAPVMKNASLAFAKEDGRNSHQRTEQRKNEEIGCAKTGKS